MSSMSENGRTIRLVTLVATLALALLVAACSVGGPPPTPPPTQPATEPSAVPPRPVPGGCDGQQVVPVSSAAELIQALASAAPGGVIRMADGVYPGNFEIGRPLDPPARLCGGQGAVLDGGAPDSGYTLHLSQADGWQVSGFTIRGGQKGLMVDRSRHVVIEGLLIEGTGDEALHLRAGSTDNVVRGNTIRNTGNRNPRFGEGIYVGSAESNWCAYTDCEPDRSDRNVIEGNDIRDTTADSVDIKEGTTGGVLQGNTFAGARMTAADSWVDVKGNEWTVTDNSGTDAPEDGFQVHVILDGWGERNVFRGNTAVVNGPGYGFNVTKRDRDNLVACSNREVAAGAGLATVDCV
ncbi:hypothetical protein GCM10009609_71200 [Pseudonocardia aurantiaca]|uniref:Nitrous oxide reductase family maturation protein NosD n=1 Tax=Pseudonocardia aurantiaca TaxID=75290 RepID=A0ABW4FXF0_9PSEU